MHFTVSTSTASATFRIRDTAVGLTFDTDMCEICNLKQRKSLNRDVDTFSRLYKEPNSGKMPVGKTLNKKWTTEHQMVIKHCPNKSRLYE